MATKAGMNEEKEIVVRKQLTDCLLRMQNPVLRKVLHATLEKQHVLLPGDPVRAKELREKLDLMRLVALMYEQDYHNSNMRPDPEEAEGHASRLADLYLPFVLRTGLTEETDSQKLEESAVTEQPAEEEPAENEDIYLLPQKEKGKRR